MPESLPARASDSGPDAQEPLDWRDQIDEAIDSARRAARAESLLGNTPAERNRERVRHINAAMDALLEARGLLCS